MTADPCNAPRFQKSRWPTRAATASRPVLALCILCLAATARAADPVDFGRDILPILSDKCFKCHGPDEANRQADLRLDDQASVMDRAVVPGDSPSSEIYRRIASTEPDVMMPPPDSLRTLTAGQIELIKQWIDEGAEWGGHWAFEPIQRPTVPQPAAWAQRVINPIDAFIFARLEQEGLAPSPQADRRSLIRRVTLDLTGLPPTLAEVDAFVADSAPGAYERLVQKLLDSPAYGERMAWDWLDAARYADSNGYQGDQDRTMWPWRDWVVRAFNDNLPFDQFTVWQCAGDLLPDASQDQKLATGFFRNHMINGEGGRIAEENRIDYVMDMTETLGTVWLGLTFNCCRCHDHKFDPLKQRDYYSLLAYFNQTPVDGGGGNPQTPPILELPSEQQTSDLARLAAQMQSAAAELAAFELALFPRTEGQTADQSPAAAGQSDAIKAILKLAPDQRDPGQLSELEKNWEKENPDYLARLQKLRTTIDQRNAVNGAIPRVMVMQDQTEPRGTFILEKGLYDKPGQQVAAAVPAYLPQVAADAPPNRLTLARWLVAPENPLTARVTVNRFWQSFFGTGLVKTPEDFGVQGEPPSHPHLLDWLAADFRDNGWDLKRLCYLITTSAAYRQSSRLTPELLERDPENRLLARGARMRMPAWMIRDQALAASGLLVDALRGPSVYPYQPEKVWEDATFGNKKYQADSGAGLYRRSLYTFWRRIIAPPMFFDSASRQVCTVKQTRTNTPLHALATLNDTTYVEAARMLAERVMSAASDPQERVDLAFRLVLARPPTSEEMTLLLATLDSFNQQFRADNAAALALVSVGHAPRNEQLDPAEHAAFAALAAAILNLDETLTRE